MAQKIDGDGLLMSETLSFALARKMSRPDAQAEVKKLAAEVRETGKTLGELAIAKWPDLPQSIMSPNRSLGAGPAEARAFSATVRKL